MLSYVVALVAFLLFFANPIANFFSPGRSASRSHLARPQLNESMIAIEWPNDTALACPQDAYSVHLLSREPLVLYIEDFLSAAEREHLLEISDPLFAPSTITHDGATTEHDASIRVSSVAVVPRTEDVRCVERRARSLQGWREDLWIERLRTQRYEPGGHYAHHFDWSGNRGGWGRVSSMMVWVAGDADEDVEGGGTEFPLLPMPLDQRWCQFLECETPVTATPGRTEEGASEDEGTSQVGGAKAGVTFKVKAGNAVYWENFRADGTGRGYDETWHAGLPVKKGVKVGLNIWSAGRIE